MGIFIRFLEGNLSWKYALVTAALFALAIFLSSAIHHPCVFQLQKLGMQIRIGLTILIYQKVLTIGNFKMAETYLRRFLIIGDASESKGH